MNGLRKMVAAGAQIVGGIGAIGQSVLLSHELTSCYPYKMMEFPAGYFYALIGWIGFLVSPTCAIVAANRIRRKVRRPAEIASTVVPVALCPLAFAVIFGFCVQASGVGGYLDRPNFDGITGHEVNAQFYRHVLELAVRGIAVGLIVGLPLLFVPRMAIDHMAQHAAPPVRRGPGRIR